MKQILNIALAACIFFSCGNPEESNTTPSQEAQIETTCEYSYNESNTVNWTAFKLTEKIGVNGTFDLVVITNTNAGESVEKMLTGANFEIYTNTVNSKDSLRDWKLANKFFNTMSEGQIISGSILSLANGTGEVALTMNDSTINTPVTYTIKDDSEIMLKSTLEIPTWGAQSALDSLSEVCAAKHTGPDGINKLWPDVEVNVFVGFDKKCN